MLLSTVLAGCAHRPAEPPHTVAVAIRDTPPAELTRCPVAPEGFPTDASATISEPVRAAAIRLATAYRALADQLARLIAWTAPATPCSPHDQAR
ncbi:hypothetical protein [Flavisphingomonas formosensis]|uniref:hypothetical protein n=1 Tax=Flavisphingomonas formosensis TaxID=861534 RepID=UPI001E3DE333|nr:hypothetical protein [Sphingomonas formosensis]